LIILPDNGTATLCELCHKQEAMQYAHDMPPWMPNATGWICYECSEIDFRPNPRCECCGCENEADTFEPDPYTTEVYGPKPGEQEWQCNDCCGHRLDDI